MRDGASTALQPPLRSSVATSAVCTEAMCNHFMKDIAKNHNDVEVYRYVGLCYWLPGVQTARGLACFRAPNTENSLLTTKGHPYIFSFSLLKSTILIQIKDHG